MRRGKLRSLALLLVLLMFAAGLAIFLYPYLWGAMVDREISLNAQGFLNRDATAPTIPEVIVTIDSPTEPEETRDYPELWADMVRYNETIYTQGQTGLSCAYDYQKPSFRLKDYGLADEVFGVISMLMILTMLPAFLFALYEKNGQHLEVIIRNMIRVLVLRPKKRPYKTNNFYAVIERQNQLDKEVYRIVHPKKAVPHAAKRGQDRNLKGKADR